MTGLVRRTIMNVAETKQFVFNCVATANATSTWQFASFLGDTPTNGISQGNNLSNRMGDKIRLRHIRITIYITGVVGTAASTGTTCRFIVYHNKRCAGALPPAGYMNTTGAAILAVPDEIYKTKVTRLKDFYHVMTPTVFGASVTAIGPPLVKEINIYPKTVVSYSSTSGKLPEIIDNDYGIGYVSDGTNCCTINVTAQVFYSDL